MQSLDVTVAFVMQKMILEQSVDEVKFLLAMGEMMLATDTSGQACFSNLAKSMTLATHDYSGSSQHRCHSVILLWGRRGG